MVITWNIDRKLLQSPNPTCIWILLKSGNEEHDSFKLLVECLHPPAGYEVE